MAEAVTEFFQFEKDAATARQKKDMQLWQTWQENGKKPQYMSPLLKAFKGTIRKESNKFAGKVQMPPSAVHAEFENLAMKAFDTFDPNRGAALHTHVTWQLKKGRRYVNTYQNFGRIPEPRINLIQQFKDERERLADRLGRDPSTHEIADKIKWPINQVTAMEKELRDEIPSSRFMGDMTKIMPSADAEILRLIQYELSPEEKAVYEYTLGANGKPMMKPGEIAKKLKMPPSKVSRLKGSIARKVESYR